MKSILDLAYGVLTGKTEEKPSTKRAAPAGARKRKAARPRAAKASPRTAPAKRRPAGRGKGSRRR